MSKVVAIFGYGLAAGEAITEAFATAGYTVAILARTQSKLDDAAKKYTDRGLNVVGYSVDLSNPQTIPPVISKIIADQGSLDVAIYNATHAILPYDVSLADLQAAVTINQTSLHYTFNTLLPIWKAAGKGVFLTSGGGLAGNGAWSVGLNMQFGAATKSYFKNFCESTTATFAGDNIRATNMSIQALVYGGTNVTFEDPDPEKSNAFRVKLGNAFLSAAEQSAEAWAAEIAVSA